MRDIKVFPVPISGFYGIKEQTFEAVVLLK